MILSKNVKYITRISIRVIFMVLCTYASIYIYIYGGGALGPYRLCCIEKKFGKKRFYKRCIVRDDVSRNLVFYFFIPTCIINIKRVLSYKSNNNNIIIYRTLVVHTAYCCRVQNSEYYSGDVIFYGNVNHTHIIIYYTC